MANPIHFMGLNKVSMSNATQTPPGIWTRQLPAAVVVSPSPLGHLTQAGLQKNGRIENAAFSSRHPPGILLNTQQSAYVDLPFRLDSSGNQTPALKKFYDNNALMRSITSDDFHSIHQEPSSLRITGELIDFYNKKFNLPKELGLDAQGLAQALVSRQGHQAIERMKTDEGLASKLEALSARLNANDLQDMLQQLFGPRITLANDTHTRKLATELTAALVAVARSNSNVDQSLRFLGNNEQGTGVEFGVYQDDSVKAGAYLIGDSFAFGKAGPKVEPIGGNALSVRLIDQTLRIKQFDDPHNQALSNRLDATNVAWTALKALEAVNGRPFDINGHRVDTDHLASLLLLDTDRPLIQGFLPTELSLSPSDPLLRLRKEALDLLQRAETFDRNFKELGARHQDTLEQARQFGFNAVAGFVPALDDALQKIPRAGELYQLDLRQPDTSGWQRL